MFRALVIAIEAGEHEVRTPFIVAALFISPEVATTCERMGLSLPGLISALELSDAADGLRRAELSLAERSVDFGSREHVESLKPRPLSAEAQQVLRDLDTEFRHLDQTVNSLDLLEAFLSGVPALRATASAQGLTVEALQAKRNEGSGRN